MANFENMNTSEASRQTDNFNCGVFCCHYFAALLNEFAINDSIKNTNLKMSVSASSYRIEIRNFIKDFILEI